MTYEQKVEGALYGLAIGDAMGAPVEGWSPEGIAKRYSSVVEFLPHAREPGTAYGKGHGRITDDTLMAEALMRAYIECGDHLDAYGFELYMIPQMAQRKVWVPERQLEMPILERLWWPEKYPWQRLKINMAEPRTAGVGNCVNCGVAMYMMPIAAINAGDYRGAYDEAVLFGSAHNESFALEAAAVMAGCGAIAFAAGSTIDVVLETAKSIGRDGTRRAVEAVLDAVPMGGSISDFIMKVRSAVAPFDQRTGHTSDDAPIGASPVSDIGRPSRLSSIEEAPVALAALKYGNGDYLATLKAAVFYGRDCDSIAGMAMWLYGAIYGIDAIPQKIRDESNAANRRNFTELAEAFSSTAKAIFAKDQARFAERQSAFR